MSQISGGLILNLSNLNDIVIFAEEQENQKQLAEENGGNDAEDEN
jgi:hypothetical protein